MRITDFEAELYAVIEVKFGWDAMVSIRDRYGDGIGGLEDVLEALQTVLSRHEIVLYKP